MHTDWLQFHVVWRVLIDSKLSLGEVPGPRSKREGFGIVSLFLLIKFTKFSEQLAEIKYFCNQCRLMKDFFYCHFNSGTLTIYKNLTCLSWCVSLSSRVLFVKRIPFSCSSFKCLIFRASVAVGMFDIGVSQWQGLWKTVAVQRLFSAFGNSPFSAKFILIKIFT